jgi:hypothetical protein
MFHNLRNFQSNFKHLQNISDNNTVINLQNKQNKPHGLSLRATAASRRSDRRLLRIKGATWSAWRIPPAVFLSFLDRSRYFSIK